MSWPHVLLPCRSAFLHTKPTLRGLLHHPMVYVDRSPLPPSVHACDPVSGFDVCILSLPYSCCAATPPSPVVHQDSSQSGPCHYAQVAQLRQGAGKGVRVGGDQGLLRLPRRSRGTQVCRGGVCMCVCVQRKRVTIAVLLLTLSWSHASPS